MNRLHITREMWLRIIADLVLTQVSLAAAMLARLLWFIAVRHGPAGTEYATMLGGYATQFLHYGWLLSLICVAVFSFSGFYTHGRAYSSGYKAIVVTQAVVVGYSFLGAIVLITSNQKDILIWPLACAINILLLLATRVWSTVWRQLVRAEARFGVRAPRRIRNVLIIGGAGYIGSALLPKVLSAGYRVCLLDLLMYGEEPIKDYLGHPNLHIIRADFRQVDEVVKAMHGMDAVIHLGGIVGDPACALNRDLTIEVNLMATRMIAEVARGSGIERFLFASTCSVYGASDLIQDEHSDLSPVSLYAQSKIASERVLMNMASGDFAPTCLRFATIYGISGRTRFDLVVNLMTAMAAVEGMIKVIDGEQWRPFLHVDDAAEAVFCALEAPVQAVRGQIFNVGSDRQNYTIEQVAQVVQTIVPTAQIIRQISGADARNYRVNFAKIHSALGFSTKWTLEQGIRQVLQSLRSGRVVHFRDAKYSNVRLLAEDANLIRPVGEWANELMNPAKPASGAALTAAPRAMSKASAQ